MHMFTIFTIWVIWWHHLVENWNASTTILVGLIQIQKTCAWAMLILLWKMTFLKEKNLVVKELKHFRVNAQDPFLWLVHFTNALMIS